METLRMRISKQGRGGKTVTVVDGFTREKKLMDSLASGLKHHLGCGGTHRQGTIELQGDVRDRLRPLLTSQGYIVKG
jgi:translation initiation factor 1